MQKTNHYLSDMSHDNTGMPQQHAMFQQQQPQQSNQQQQQQQQQRQMTQGQRTSYDSNVNNMGNPVPLSFSEKGPSFEDPVSMRARLKLDYMKSFQDDSHFYPEFPNYQNVSTNQYGSHLPMNNFNNIQLQHQQQNMFGNEQQNNIFNRSTTPNNNANYLNQKQYNQKLSDRENLLSLLAQKSLEKQQFQQQQQQQQQQQYSKQTKRPNSQHYYQHQQQGDPYLVN